MTSPLTAEPTWKARSFPSFAQTPAACRRNAAQRMAQQARGSWSVHAQTAGPNLTRVAPTRTPTGAPIRLWPPSGSHQGLAHLLQVLLLSGQPGLATGGDRSFSGGPLSFIIMDHPY